MDVTLTSFGGPGAPCTLLISDALDLRVVFDCGATPVVAAASAGAASPALSLRAPDVRALVASAAPSSTRNLDPCPFADAVLLTSPAAVLGLPLLYRAALEASRDCGGGAGASSPLPLHTYATEACLEVAEHWVAELLDAEGQRRRDGAAAAAAAATNGAAGATPTTAPPTTTPLFSARDARRALACVRPVRFGEGLALPGGGRVVAEALPASGARLGVCCWRLRAGATERLVYLGPCSSLLKGHAAPLDLKRALEGACAVVLGPGVVDTSAGEEDDDDAAAAQLLLAEGRPRPPLLEQSLRGGADPADARHAAAVHRAARAALDAVSGSGGGAENGSGAGEPARAPVAVAVDPTGAAFDFLEALEHEARLARGVEQEKQQQQAAEDFEEDEDEEEEEEEGELERPAAAAAPAPPATTPPVRVAYAGPAAEGSLALATSAAEFLSPGRLSKVVRRAAAPFAHGRMMMMRAGQQQEGGDDEAAQQQQKQQQRPGPPVRLRVGDEDDNTDIAIVPAARLLAGKKTDQGRMLILLGTAAAAAATAPPPANGNGRVLRIPLPGERGLDPKALLEVCQGTPAVVVAAASQPEADALRAALGAATVVVAYGRAPCTLPALPAPLYEAWLSGSLASRVVLSPLPPPTAQGQPPLSAARLPPVRVSVEAGGGGGAWRVDAEEEEGDERVEAVVGAALCGVGFEVSERRREEEEEEEDEGPVAVVALAVAGGGGAAEVRLAFSPSSSRLRSVLVLSDDGDLRERLRGVCEGAMGAV